MHICNAVGVPYGGFQSATYLPVFQLSQRQLEIGRNFTNSVP
jgi:hypothetical protein